MDCSPVGVLRTPFETADDAPRQGFLGDAEGRVELDPAYEPGLAGLRPGDRLEVVWFAHRADRSVLTVDRLRGGAADAGGTDAGTSRGVFATRSPARPNPVMATTCDLLEVEGETLRVRGVDAVDGTPLLDLRPPVEAPIHDGG